MYSESDRPLGATLKIDNKIPASGAVLESTSHINFSIVEFLSENYQPELVFNWGNNEWQKAYQASEALNHLATLRSSRFELDSETKVSERAYFKGTRKHGARLFDAWCFYDERHTYPPTLERVVTGMGNIQDTLAYPGRLKKAVTKLETYIEAYKGNDGGVLQVATVESFLNYYASRLVDITEHLNKDVLTLEDHHRLRRRARSFRHLFTLIAKVTGDNRAEALSNYLLEISDEMGKEQDGFRKQEFAGLADKDMTTTSLNPDHRQKLKTFVTLHTF